MNSYNDPNAAGAQNAQQQQQQQQSQMQATSQSNTAQESLVSFSRLTTKVPENSNMLLNKTCHRLRVHPWVIPDNILVSLNNTSPW